MRISDISAGGGLTHTHTHCTNFETARIGGGVVEVGGGEGGENMLQLGFTFVVITTLWRTLNGP